MLLVRRLALPAALLTGALLLAGCGGNDSGDGSLPVPVDGDASSTTSSSTPSTSTSEPNPQPSRTTTRPNTSKQKLIVINPGNYSSNPAVQGLVRTYPL